MATKLNCILLIDDDEITNFLNEQTIIESGVSQNIEIAETAVDALALLEKPRIKSCKSPDLIFLDLNMPGMTGWDFIDEFKKIKTVHGVNSRIIILTTSTNPDEEKRAQHILEVTAFRSKPLTHEMINQIIAQHFDV